MKNPKVSGKDKFASRKPPSSSSAADDQRPSDNPAAFLPQFPPHDRPIQPPSLPSHPFHPFAGSPFPQHNPPAAAPPLPPPYGFHNLDRRSVVLADGSVRSYFALPADYRMEPVGPYGHWPRPAPGPGFERPFPHLTGRFSPERPPFAHGPGSDYLSSLAPDGGPPSLKRKYGEDDEFAWHRKHVLQYGNPNGGIPSGSGGDRHEYPGRPGSPLRQEHHDELRPLKQPKIDGEGLDDGGLPRGRPDGSDAPAAVDVEQKAVRRAFLKFVKLINENESQKKNFLEDGKSGKLKCLACDRASKEFTDLHGVVMHAYYSQKPELRTDHLGLHKALCALMGWNYVKAPEKSKAYQSLSADDARINMEDLILWPPTVIIHNTNSGKRKDGRMEGMGNKEMDIKLKELGFSGGKSKSLYGKEGHLGVTLVKFSNTPTGLKEADRLVEFFEKDDHGRKGWEQAHASQTGDDDDNPALVKVDAKTGEKKRIFYGYLSTASDLEKVDPETRKKAIIKSKREFDLSD